MFLIKIYMFIFFFHLVVPYNKNQFHYSYFFRAKIINSVDLRGYSYLGIMLVDIEQWHAEIGNFHGCLHYAIIKLEINLFNIMVRVSQALALILAIISQYVFKINRAFHFLNIIFCVCFVIYCLEIYSY